MSAIPQEVECQRVSHFLGQRHAVDESTLAPNDDLALIPVDVLEFESGHLSGAQAEPGQQQEHGMGPSTACRAAVRRGEDLLFLVLFVREGKLVSSRHHRVCSDAGYGEALGSFLAQFYAEGKAVPPEILVSTEMEGRDLLESWLASVRGAKVAIRVPKRGVGRELLNIGVPAVRQPVCSLQAMGLPNDAP